MRLVGERRALAAAVMAFFAILFFLNGVAGPPELAPMFLGLGATYFAGFFGLVAGWFWARWFAMGVGFSGLVIAGILGVQIGLDPIVLIFGGSHLGVVLGLMGRGPAAAFDGRADWRERWRMDENAVNRLGKAITRAGASLPYLVMVGLAPRGGGLGAAALALAALGLGVLGLRALVKLRTWGVAALGGAALTSLAGLWGASEMFGRTGATVATWGPGGCQVSHVAARGTMADHAVTVGGGGLALLLAAVLLTAAILPLVPALWRALRTPGD
jgi:hypothetical protein